MSKLNIKRQTRCLYSSSVLANLSLTGAWVAILAARGYSLPEIGIAEAVFHLTSIIFEIPSGVLADVLGRKRMLIISSIMHVIANIIMILSFNLFTICLSIAFNALCYNFSSGSGEALAFDSFKEVNQKPLYDKYLSNQMIIYRLFEAISTLCAGFALYIGHQLSYGIDIISCLLQILILSFLVEVKTGNQTQSNVTFVQLMKAILNCFKESIRFMFKSARAFRLMFFNSLVGAFDILLLFFIQAKFPEIGVKGLALGAVLFTMHIGGILGSKVTLLLKKIPYIILYLLCLTTIIAGILIEHSSLWYLMTLGGFISAFADDALQIRTNSILQNMFPSEQRATLISIDSFIFSLIMIVLSPIAGFFFAAW
ncbi:MAG: MFS transporter [Clostridia bacterium]|nr:MFS transporter [Clostridia bacterium]